MEEFRNCLCILSFTNFWSNLSEKLDFIYHLPPEIACTILRQLDDKSLFSSAFVSKYWQRLCKSDPVLRKRITDIIKKHQEEQSIKENQPLESSFSSIRRIINKFNPQKKSEKALKNIKNKFTNSKKRKRREDNEQKPAKCLRM